MQITYIFHSCYVVETQHYILVFDYYKGTLPMFDANKQILFFVSHAHEDHFSSSIWKHAKLYPKVGYIIERSICLANHVEGIQVQGNYFYDYQGLHIQTLTSTDEGVAFLVEVDGYVMYHAGDLNWWHWEGEPETDNVWHKQAFLQEINKLKGRYIDVAFLPLDPRQEDNAWWGFEAVLKTCTIKHAFPMHFNKDVKKMQCYLHQKPLCLYSCIVQIDQINQIFSYNER